MFCQDSTNQENYFRVQITKLISSENGFQSEFTLRESIGTDVTQSDPHYDQTEILVAVEVRLQLG